MTPQQQAQILRQIEAHIRAGNAPQAIRAARDAAARGVVHYHVFVMSALHEMEANAPANALAFARRALEMKPRGHDAMQVFGMALAGTGRHQEAIRAYDESLRAQPGNAEVHYHKGLSFEETLDWARAQREYERTLDIDPKHAGAATRLITFVAAQGQPQKARDLAQRALRLKPGDPAALLALAQLDLNDGEFDAVLTSVAPLLAERPGVSLHNRGIAESLNGDALDGLGRHAQAFLSYTRANQTLKELHHRLYGGFDIERVPARVRRVLSRLSGGDLARWRDCDLGNYRAPVETHVFLVGFPRSGTTLLEQILASHDGIEALEERDCLASAMAEFMLPLDGLDRLDALGGDALARFRDAYWSEVRAHGTRLDRPVFVDKLPFNLLNWPLIAKLFPKARILLALRDPRDVVLSCFRRRFRMSPFMYELFALDSAAEFYAVAMDFAEFCRNNLTLPCFVSRYEDLVSDFQPRVEAICAFLGVEYDAAMRDFAERRQGRMIRTPSAPQVTRGLYQSGQQQWRAYAKEMAPVLPLLAPYVARYGYEVQGMSGNGSAIERKRCET